MMRFYSKISSATAFCLVLSLGCVSSVAQGTDTTASSASAVPLKNPANQAIDPSAGSNATSAPIATPVAAPTPEYNFHVDSLNPTAVSNPAGSSTPGFRGAGQLIVYTPTFGPSTQTNTAGVEVTVVDGFVTRTGVGNSPIPDNGWVISAHGAAAQWLARFGRPGALVVYDNTANQLRLRFTPAVYINKVNIALQRAETRVPVDPDTYRQHLAAAQVCQAHLQKEAEAVLHDPVIISPAWQALADECEKEADRAFYNTVTAQENEFRGAWIRPDVTDPQQIAARLAQMKRLGIQHIFLETYYQGETVYPSAVMASYGLPVQHPQFRGVDPLQLWIDAAHREGLKTHAWLQVFFAGNHDENAEPGGPILQKYPQWRNIERAHIGSDRPIVSDVEPGHYFLDPANPDVRTFLEKIFLEITTRYPVDGLNLDYIRYPASRPVYNSTYLATTWGYTDGARHDFKTMIEKERAEAEKIRKASDPKARAHTYPSADPKDLMPNNPLWPRWVAWRKEQVSLFVQSISEKAHRVRPDLLMSAVVFPASDPTYAQKLQNYPLWTHEGWIQALTPIGLSTIPERMALQAQQIKAQVPPQTPVYIGIFSLYNREPSIEMLRQMEAVHQAKMPGFVFFDWSRLNADYEEALREGPFRHLSAP